MVKGSPTVALLACASVVLSQPGIGAPQEERFPSAFEQLTQTLLGESGAAVAEEIEIEGTLEILVEDRHDGSRVLNFLDSDSGQRHALFFASQSPDLLAGTRVRVKGLRVGEAIAVESGTRDVERIHALARSSAPGTAALPNTFGVQKTVVILVNFSNDTSQLYTIDQARTGYAAADDWYRKASYQQTSLAVDVFGWFTLPLSNTSCDVDQADNFTASVQ